MCKRQRKTGPGTGRKHQSTEFDHVLSSPWSPKPPVCAAMENGRDALVQLLVALDGAKGNRTDLSCMLHCRALPPDALSPACSSPRQLPHLHSLPCRRKLRACSSSGGSVLCTNRHLSRANPNVPSCSIHACHVLGWGQRGGSLLFPQSH